MEIDFNAIEEALDQIICSSFLNANNVIVFPKDPTTLNKLVELAKAICE